MFKIVGIGGYALSNQTADRIKTYALSSCVAVTAYCPAKNAGGMIHVALPYPLEVENHTPDPPAYFAKTGVPFLIRQMESKFGCNKKELKIHVFGGANSSRKDDKFRIGFRNIQAVTDVLESMQLKYVLTDVGGLLARSVELEVGTGDITVFRQPIAI